MKHIKKFEQINNKPEIGDYVLCKAPNSALNPYLIDYLNSNFGQIVDEFTTNTMGINYYVEYENIPEELKPKFLKSKRIYREDSIIEYAKTKEELEVKLSAKKYNL